MVNSSSRVIALCLALLCVLSTEPAFAVSEASNKWEKLYKAGNLAVNKGEYWIAKPTLHECLDVARTFEPNDIRLAKTLDELGRYYTIRATFPIAEPFLEEALLVKQRAWGVESDEFIPALGAMCRFYLLYGTKSKADPVAEEVLFLVGGKMKEPVWKNHGKVKLKPGEALEAWAGVADPKRRSPALDWAIVCEDLGYHYRMQKNYAMSQRFFEAALDVKAMAVGKEHLSLAVAYDYLGSLLMEKEEYPQAENNLRDALSITQKILPPESWEVYSRLDKLARCLIKEKKYKEAEGLYLKAQHLWDDAPSKYGEEARAKFALGCLYADSRNFSAAAPVLAQALNMSRRINGPDSINVVPYMRKYAYVLYYLGRRSETDNLRGRSDVISGNTR